MWWISCAAGQALSPDVLTLAHAMNTNRDLMKQVPLYTCLETIERTRPKSHDVVQVEVGVDGMHEMYSWPGAANFSSPNLPELVVHGLLSTGLFSGFARNLLVDGNGLVQFASEDSPEGFKELRFTYQIPALQNPWSINWDGRIGELEEAGEAQTACQSR